MSVHEELFHYADLLQALKELGWAISNFLEGDGDEAKLRVAQKKAYEIQKRYDKVK
jgi:hypothetical protein